MARHRENFRAFVVAIVIVAMLAPWRTAVAATNTFENPKFKMLILTVAMLNKAMQDASNNPMDEWRRVNVQRAIQMLPPALIALAGEYKNGTLDGQDFPKAYQVVAGFVDKAAANGYQKFLKKPDRSLIPQLPANFPKVTAPPVPGGSSGPGDHERLAYDESRSAQGDAQVPMKNAALSNELVNLSSVNSGSGSAPRETLRYDESQSRDAAPSRVDSGSSTSSSSPVGPMPAPQAASNWQSGSAAVREAQRDLDRIESQVGSSNLTVRSATDGSGRAPASVASEEAARDKGKIFESVGKDAEQAADKKKARARRSKKTSALESLMNFAVRIAEVTILPGQAFAESSGGGGGGGGGEGGGSGEAAQLASALLFGAAEIIKAIAPIQVAQIQADADKTIATINSNTQKYLTDQTANTSKYLADQQKDIAVFQSNLARTIASEQQQNVNYRLDRQLAELKDARKDAEAVQTTIRNKEWEYNERRLQIAEDQSQKNYELAQQALQAQLTASGLSSGFANSFDSGNQLTTSGSTPSLGGVGGTAQQALTNGFTGSTNVAGLGASSASVAAGGSSSGAVRGASAEDVASASGSAGGSAAGGVGGLGGGAGSLGLGGGGGASNRSAEAAVGGSVLGGKEGASAFQRLVNSVGSEDGAAAEDSEAEANSKHSKDGKKKPAKRSVASLRLSSTKVGADGKPVVTSPIAKADGKSSDLIKFFGDARGATTFASEPAPVSAAAKPKSN